MKKVFNSLIISLALCLLITIAVVAQGEQLTLKLSRDWGYGGFNGDIQGLFTMHVTGPTDLAKVNFYIDSTAIGEVDKAPFNLQFNTENYPLGIHELSAVGSSATGQEYHSNLVRAEFVPASQSSKVILPIVSILLAVVLLSAAIPLVMSRRTKKLPMGTERNYGAGGGAICPRCQRPFPLSLLSPHLGFSKLAVCPYCGKVSLVRPQPVEQLRAAEKAELDGEQVSVPEESEEEKLKKELDDSKYQGS
jgi:hypothetical protein